MIHGLRRLQRHWLPFGARTGTVSRCNRLLIGIDRWRGWWRGRGLIDDYRGKHRGRSRWWRGRRGRRFGLGWNRPCARIISGHGFCRSRWRRAVAAQRQAECQGKIAEAAHGVPPVYLMQRNFLPDFNEIRGLTDSMMKVAPWTRVLTNSSTPSMTTQAAGNSLESQFFHWT